MTLIKREDAIDAICKEWCYVTYGNCPHVDDGFVCDGCDDVKALNALPSAEAEWIPCSERLPETHTEYVIENPWMQVSITKDTYQLSNPVLGYGKRKYHSDGDPMMAVVWYEDDGYDRTGWITAPDCEDIDVIAWMPLPKPYREENEE